MDKPKKRFRMERKRYHSNYEYWHVYTFYFGRVRLTGKGFAAIIGMVVGSLLVWQLVLGLLTGWTSFIPLYILSAVVLLGVGTLIAIGLVKLFRWLGAQFTIDGPGKG